MEKGKLIVSTKTTHPWRLRISFMGMVFGIIFSIVCFVYPRIFFDISPDFYWLIAYAFGVFILCYDVWNFFAVLNGQKSYIAVYDECLEGYTAIGKKAQEAFEVKYSDVVNIGVSQYKITIYTKYTNYEVMAMKNKDEAVSEIQKKIQFNKN